MIAVVAAISVSAIVGLLVVRAIGSEGSSWMSLAGESLLIGVGSTALVLQVVSMLGIPWSILTVGIAIVAVCGLLWIVGTRRGGLRASPGFQWRPAAIPFDAATLVLVIGYAIFATLVRLPEHDFLAIWGLKGRTFWEARGIDWSFLSKAWNDFSHPDYPLLVPMSFDFVALFAGGWEDRWIGLLYPAIGVGALLVAREELSRISRSPFLTSVATFALAGFALTPWVGLGDGVVAAYALAALCLLRGGLDREDALSIVRGGVLLGFAAMTKNEGVATLVAYAATAIVLSRDRWRTAVCLWPAAVIPLPWWIGRAIYRIDSGILRGSLVDRVVGNIANPEGVIRTLLTQHIVSRWAIAGIALALALSLTRRVARREAFAMSAVALQVALYVSAYFVASYELDWLVRWSWERVASQFLLPLAFVGCVLALRRDAVR